MGQTEVLLSERSTYYYWERTWGENNKKVDGDKIKWVVALKATKNIRHRSTIYEAEVYLSKVSHQ